MPPLSRRIATAWKDGGSWQQSMPPHTVSPNATGLSTFPDNTRRLQNPLPLGTAVPGGLGAGSTRHDFLGLNPSGRRGTMFRSILTEIVSR
jgi:hypothetical protein